MEVRQQCQARLGKKVFCIKGMPGPNRPYVTPPKQQKITIAQQYIGLCWQYQLGVDSGKQIIQDNLRVRTPGAKYCHFPRRDDYGAAYFTGLLSERLEYDATKKQPWIWKKIPGHERNEALDCRNYALAVFKAIPTNLDEIDRKLKAARGKAPSTPVATAPVAAQRRKVKPKKGSSAVDKYYDSW